MTKARRSGREGRGSKRGRREGVKYKRKERGFVEGRGTELHACLKRRKGQMGVGRKDKRNEINTA
jgi:hypothetical protein